MNADTYLGLIQDSKYGDVRKVASCELVLKSSQPSISAIIQQTTAEVMSRLVIQSYSCSYLFLNLA